MGFFIQDVNKVDIKYVDGVFRIVYEGVTDKNFLLKNSGLLQFPIQKKQFHNYQPGSPFSAYYVCIM